MANPFDAFKDLKPWQQGAVAIGGLGVVGVVIWQHQKAKKTPAIPVGTPAAAAASGVASAAGEVQDPTTGDQYPIDAIDPNSGLPYGQEIAEYGSVSAADTATGAGYQAASQGVTPQEYVEQTGGTPGVGATVTTNAQWMAEVETGLSEQGYSASDIGQGLAAYFASKPLGTSSEGTNLFTMMNLAISEYGPPPTGSYPLLIGSSTPAAGNGSGGSTTPSGAPRTAPDPLTIKPGKGEVTVSWPPVGGATSYEVDITGPEGSAQADPKTSSTSVTVPLGVKKNYLLKARAINSAGAGPWSATKTFSIAAAK